MLSKILPIIILLITTEASAMKDAMKIVTINDDPTHCLSTKTDEIPMTKEGLKDAKKVANELTKTLLPLMPAAGLAAPQIGISKQVFIFSWNRSPDTLETAINPSFEPIDNEMISSWESCFSTVPTHGKVEAAFLKRYKKIKATYTDLDGKVHHQILEDFAAKVFQHEYDHLQGLVNVRKKGAEVKVFKSKAELFEFMTEVKKKDAVHYVKPKD